MKEENTNQETLTASYYIFLPQYPSHETWLIAGISIQKLLSKIIFNNEIDRSHYSDLLKENL